MTSPLAIAAVTHVLRDLLNDGIHNNDLSAGIGGPIDVSSFPPDRLEPLGASERSRLNLFMYMATHNAGWRNQFLPSHNFKGDRVSNPPLALDLHYLLTAYGQHELHYEILLGYGMQLMHENPVLTREAIRRSLTPPTQATPGTLPADLQMLSNSGLADQIEQIKISSETLNTEEISRLWAAFGTKYRPHAAYKVTVVLIESNKPSKPALPVLQRNIVVLPFKKPSIEKIRSKVDGAVATPILEGEKILQGHFLVLDGVNLASELTFVNVSGKELPTAAGNVTDQQIVVQLPNDLKAGVHGVQVVHKLNLGTPPFPHDPHVGFNSNVAAFVLSPCVKNPVFGANAVSLTVEPAVHPSQRVVMLLNQLNPPAMTPPTAHTFLLPPMNFDDPPTGNLTIPVTGLGFGSYLVRLQVDGAESPLTTDPVTNAFNNPVLNVP